MIECDARLTERENVNSKITMISSTVGQRLGRMGPLGGVCPC